MKQILLVDDKASIGKVLSMYLGKEYDLAYCEDPDVYKRQLQNVASLLLTSLNANVA